MQGRNGVDQFSRFTMGVALVAIVLTLFTGTRYLPAVMKEAGVVQSTSEVRKNRPDLNISLENPDCLWVKWGKKRLYVIVGE